MTNLLSNPGFELDFTDWTPGPDTIISTVDPQSGTKCVEKSIIGSIGFSNIVSQVVSTPGVIGTNYTLRVWVKPMPPPAPVTVWSLSMNINGFQFFQDINNNYGVWRRYTISRNATTVSQTVTFQSLINKSFPEPVQMFLDTTQFAPTSLICFARDTMIKTRRGMVAVQDLQEGVDEIEQIDGNYQLLQRLVVTGPTTRLVKIKAGLISEDTPNRDTILTRGHKVVVDGQEIKAINLPGRNVLNAQSELVYAPIVGTRMIGSANGMAVVIDGESQFVTILDREPSASAEG